MEKLVNLQLLHTHFKLKEGEIIIEKMSHNETMTKPQMMKDLNMSTIAPYLYKFTNDGNVIPLEYVEESEHMTCDQMTRIINASISVN